MLCRTLCRAPLPTINVVETARGVRSEPLSIPVESNGPDLIPRPQNPQEVGATYSSVRKSGDRSLGLEEDSPRSLARPQPIRLVRRSQYPYRNSQPLGGWRLRILLDCCGGVTAFGALIM